MDPLLPTEAGVARLPEAKGEAGAVHPWAVVVLVLEEAVPPEAGAAVVSGENCVLCLSNNDV